VFVALGIQYAKRVRLILLLSVTCLAAQCLSTLSYKRQGLRKKFIEHKMCVLIFSTNQSETFLILRRIQRNIIIIVNWSTCEVRVILVMFS
jgi:hypothetical protein